jgi:hypothetical protein
VKSLTTNVLRKQRITKGCKYKDVLFKSSYEAKVAEVLDKAGYKWEYEPDSFEYVLPPKKYTPDFKVYLEDGTFKYLEVKGFFDGASRFKMLLIKEQHPDLPIDIHLMRNNRLSKGSNHTYADWCTKQKYPTSIGLESLKDSFPRLTATKVLKRIKGTSKRVRSKTKEHSGAAS